MADRAPTKAEEALTQAKTRRVLADAEMAEAARDTALINLEREKHKREVELSKDDYHYVYRFTGSVDGSTVQACIDKLSTWHRTDPACPMTLVLNSPGGAVVPGFALWDFLEEFKAAGHHLTTVARGYAASMAGILLQAGDIRVMGAQASLLIHEGSFGAGGSVAQVEDQVEWVKKLHERILDIFAARSKLSKPQLRRRWHRKDWWLTSDEALKYGFVDEVGGGGVV